SRKSRFSTIRVLQMSQRTQKKRRSTLQIITAALALTLSACATQPNAPAPKQVGKSLRFVKIIDDVGVGSNDFFKQILAGDEHINLRSPVAIDVRDDVMIIADRGEMVDYAGMHLRDKQTSVASAKMKVHDYNTGLIFKYNLKTNRMDILHGAGDAVKDEVSDVYLAKDGSFYVTDIEGRRALHFSPEGKLLKIYRHPPNIFRPIAITVDEERKEVLVADETYSHIVAFDMDSGEPKYGMGDRGNGPGKFRIITDMIAIPDGYLVSDRIELRVQVLDKAGNYIADFGRDELMFPTALAMDKFGRVYVTDKSDSLIKVFKAGKLVERIGRNGYGPGEFRYVSDMKIYKDQLYVVDNLNGRIQVFDIIPEGDVALVH
ncbi:MAG: 6-bladed beta-propeller, partial [Gammaproteobacteria bacterium]|nr:6-bladed beta-propeller [Gammaproteobacteria bacterium]